MISLAFVNGAGLRDVDKICFPYESFLESVDMEIDNILHAYKSKNYIVTLESEIMGKTSEKDMLFLEEEKKSIVAKLGEVIIDIFNKIIEMIKKARDFIKNIGFRNKSDLQKLDMFVDKHPELKDEVVMAYKNGELNLSDMKSLQELDKAYAEIIRLSREEQGTPKTLREKWEEALKKYEEKASTATKIVGAATAVITLALAIYTFKQKRTAADMACIESTNELNEARRQAYERLKEEKIIDDNMGRCEIITAIGRELAGKHEKACKHNMNVIDRMQNSIDKFIDKTDKKLAAVTGDQSDAFRKDMKTAITRAKAAEEAEKEKKEAEYKKQKEIEAEVRRQDARDHENEDRTRKTLDYAAQKRVEAEIKRADANAHADEDLERTYKTELKKLEAKRADADAHAVDDSVKRLKEVYDSELKKLKARRADQRIYSVADSNKRLAEIRAEEEEKLMTKFKVDRKLNKYKNKLNNNGGNP